MGFDFTNNTGGQPFGAPFAAWLREGLGSVDQMTKGARLGRGNLRSTILTLLAEQPMHGYQLIAEIQNRSHGLWRPSPGSVYPTLQLLADEGLIHATAEGEKKTYSLTEEGRAVVEGGDHAAPWESPVAQAAEKASALPKAGVKLAQAMAQFNTGASKEQVDKAVEVIDEARRKLFLILAEG